MSPTAMGQIPFLFFFRGIKRLTQSHSTILSQIWPVSHCRVKRSRAMRRRCEALCSAVRSQSILKVLGAKAKKGLQLRPVGGHG